jgi:hypothetical protein
MGDHINIELRHGARWTFDRVDRAGLVKKVCEVGDVMGHCSGVVLGILVARQSCLRTMPADRRIYERHSRLPRVLWRSVQATRPPQLKSSSLAALPEEHQGADRRHGCPAGWADGRRIKRTRPGGGIACHTLGQKGSFRLRPGSGRNYQFACRPGSCRPTPMLADDRVEQRR